MSAFSRTVGLPVRPLGSLPHFPVDSGVVKLNARDPLPTDLSGSHEPHRTFTPPRGFTPLGSLRSVRLESAKPTSPESPKSEAKRS